MQRLLKHFKIYYEILNVEGLILPSDPSFWEYLELDLPEQPLPLEEIFPELFGMEAEVERILSSGGGELRIPAISRGDRFFDLSVIFEAPDAGIGAPGLVVVKDRTAEMHGHQVLVQKKNEISLLSAQLETRNAELRDMNDRLESLMYLIRTQNHDLDTKVKVRTRELHNSRLSVITTLARVAEFRDTDTGGHIYRIGRSCVLIGKQYGLPPSECEILFYSSLLHDVGKIGIPDSVLLKPSPLNREERITMRRHTLIGAELLRRDDDLIFSAAREVALYHHEKWNGLGYPEHLAAEKIPIMSRICTVADVFDALISERPYKRAWSTEKATDLILRGSGTSFDPAVVQSFREVRSEILDLRKESEDLELLMPEFG